MLLTIIPSIIIIVGLYIYAGVLRSKMEHRITVDHRDFLKSIKVDGANKLKNAWVYGEGKHALFSIEINGKRRRYDSLFTDKSTLSKLNDQELLSSCCKLIVVQRLFYLTLVISILLGIAASNT